MGSSKHKKGKEEMEKIGKRAYEFERRHPMLANIIGITSIALLIILSIITYIYKTR